MGRASAPDLDGASLRHEVLTHTGVLARLSSARDQQKLFEPVLPRRSVQIWYARHRSICNWDPLHVALASLADVEAHERLPASLDELGDCRAIVVAAPRPNMPPFSFAELDHWRACGRGRQVPVMYLAAQPPEQAGPATPPGVTCIKYPVSLAALSGILTEMTGAPEPAVRVA
jgi:hypothetical protein